MLQNEIVSGKRATRQDQMEAVRFLMIFYLGCICNGLDGDIEDKFSAAPYSILKPIQQTEGKFRMIEQATEATNRAEGRDGLKALHVASILIVSRMNGASGLRMVVIYGFLSQILATNLESHNIDKKPATKLIHNQNTIVVFDSAAKFSKNNTVKIRAISLKGVLGCDGTAQSYEKPKIGKVQVLHVPLTTGITVYQCRVTYTVYTQYCSSNIFISSIYPKEIYVRDHMFVFSNKDCERFYETSETAIVLFEKTVILKGATYNTINKDIILYGQSYSKKHGDGGCTGISFDLGSRSYDNTVLSAHIAFSVQKRKALFDSTSSMIRVEPDLIEFPLSQDGASCDRDKGCFCYHVDKIPKSRCQRVQQIFKGVGTFFRPKHTSNDRLAREIVQIRSQDESQTITIVIEGLDRMCGHQVLRTSITGLYINKIITDHDIIGHSLMTNGSYQMSPFEGIHLDLLTSINTGVVTSALKNTEKFDAISREICEQRRYTLINSIRDILISESSQLLNLKRGLVFKRVGGISYLYAGPAKLVKIRTTKDCYTDIPIEFEHDGTIIKMFATSNGRILIENSTRVDCDQEVPIHFIPTLDDDIDLETERQNSVLGLVDNKPPPTMGSWYCQSSRKFYSCASPESLNPSAPQSLKFNGVTGDIVSGSIFGDKGREQLFKIQTSSHRNKLISEKLGGMIGNSDADIGVVLVTAITQEGGELLRQKIYPTFYWLFGDWLHSFERFVIITIAVSMMINILCLTIRIKNLFVRFGFSARLLIGICEQVYTLILPLATKGNEGEERVSSIEFKVANIESNIEDFNNAIMKTRCRDMDFGIEENRRELTKIGLRMMNLESNIGEFSFQRFKELRWRVDALALGQLSSPRLLGDGSSNRQENVPFQHLFNIDKNLEEQTYEQLTEGTTRNVNKD